MPVDFLMRKIKRDVDLNGCGGGEDLGGVGERNHNQNILHKNCFNKIH